MGYFKLENVSYQYPLENRKVLKNINLDIKKGEKTVFLGENGSGKSNIVDSFKLLRLSMDTMRLSKNITSFQAKLQEANDKDDFPDINKLVDSIFTGRSFKELSKNTPRISAKGDTKLEFCFSIENNDGVYILEYDSKGELTSESLEFVINSNKGNHFKIKRNSEMSVKLNKSIFKKGVFTDLQDLTRQEKLLKENGVPEENIFADVGSGKDFNRPQYQKLINKTIKQGDTIYIASIDRLGRDIKGIEEQYNLIINIRGCKLISITEPFLQSTGVEEIDSLINPIILKMLSWFAERERKEMLKRQRMAYNSMQKNEKGKLISNRTGEPVGRKAKSKEFTKEQKQILKDWILEQGELSTKYILLVLKVSRPTLFKLKKQYLNGELKI